MQVDLQVLTIVLLLISTAISIVLLIRKGGVQAGRSETVVEALIQKVEGLPCIKDPQYMASMGELKGIVGSLSSIGKDLSQRLDEVNKRLDQFIQKSK